MKLLWSSREIADFSIPEFPAPFFIGLMHILIMATPDSLLESFTISIVFGSGKNFATDVLLWL